MSDAAADLRVIAGSPTDEETAAIAAVFTQLVLERDASTERLPPAPAPSLWMRTRRGVRDPRDVDRTWR